MSIVLDCTTVKMSDMFNSDFEKMLKFKKARGHFRMPIIYHTKFPAELAPILAIVFCRHLKKEMLGTHLLQNLNTL